MVSELAQNIIFGGGGYTFYHDVYSDMRREDSKTNELMEETANVLDNKTLKLLLVSVQENKISVYVSIRRPACDRESHWLR